MELLIIIIYGYNHNYHVIISIQISNTFFILSANYYINYYRIENFSLLNFLIHARYISILSELINNLTSRFNIRIPDKCKVFAVIKNTSI